MRLRWRRKPPRVAEDELVRLLETRGMKAFRVLPSGEALIVHHRRPGPGGADPKETRE